MRKELENELEPINMAWPDFWNNVTKKLTKHPGKVLPVYLEVPGFEQPFGDYFIRLVREEKGVFIQIEGFSSNSLEKGFLKGSSKNWVLFQPGIYRLDITN